MLGQQEFERSGWPLEYQGTDYLPCKRASRSSLVKPVSLSNDKSVPFGNITVMFEYYSATF
jgi:hypothetical protein